jgi:hypothetical protein
VAPLILARPSVFSTVSCPRPLKSPAVPHDPAPTEPPGIQHWFPMIVAVNVCPNDTVLFVGNQKQYPISFLALRISAGCDRREQ